MDNPPPHSSPGCERLPPFVVNQNSVLTFDFKSDSPDGPSQVVAIGFDMVDINTNGVVYAKERINEELTFRVHGFRDTFAKVDGWGRPIDETLEVELLRRYFNKDHAFRHDLINLAENPEAENPDVSVRRALNSGMSATGNLQDQLEKLVGDSNVDLLFWKQTLDAEPYLWAHAGTGGFYWGNPRVDTSWLIQNTSRAVFTSIVNSYAMDWSYSDSVLRAVLANDGYGLFSTWGNFQQGSNEFNYSEMASGATLGDSYLVMQNSGTGLIYNAIMGDPTLRMHVVLPPSDVVATPVGSNVELTWIHSPEQGDDGQGTDNVLYGGTFLGYHVYRADSITGNFDRVLDSDGNALVETNSLTISNADENAVYMIRAVKQETNDSGSGTVSYRNMSQGVFSQGIALLNGYNAGEGTVSHFADEGSFVAGAVDLTPISAPTIDITSHASVPIGTPKEIFQTASVQGASEAAMLWTFGASEGIVSGGTYSVRLYFAEIDSYGIAAGDRVFDINVEGSTLDDFDIFAEVGANTALVKTFNVTVGVDGELNISFDADTINNLALVSAIEIFSL